MVYLAGFARFHNQPHPGAGAFPDQVVVDGSGSQQAGNGGQVAGYAPVGQDDDAVTLADGLGSFPAKAAKGFLERAFTLRTEQGGQGNGPYVAQVKALYLRQFFIGNNGRLDFYLAAVQRGLLEEIAFTADEALYRRNQFFADGVQGRVGNLGEQLLEVVEE